MRRVDAPLLATRRPGRGTRHPTSGQTRLPVGRGPRAVPRPRRPLRPVAPPLRPPRRRPRLRSLRGRRPALSVPRLAIRHHRRLPGTTRGAHRLHVSQQSPPTVLSLHRAPRHRLGLPRHRRPSTVPRLRLLRRTGLARVRFQRPMVLQLAAGAGSRHRPGARQLPASLFRRRGHLRGRLWPPVPRRDRWRRHSDDPAHA